MEKQALNCGATIEDSTIISIEKRITKKENNTEITLFKVVDSNDQCYYAKSIIVATGSNPNKLHLPNEDLYWGKGISSCAVCDGALYKKKKIFVVGGGDTAMEEALFLTKFSEVTLIHRRDTFRASAVMQNRVIEHPKIQILYNTVVSEVLGDETELTHIVIKNVLTNEEKKIDLERGALFYGLGLTPNVKLFTDNNHFNVSLDKEYRKCHHCTDDIPNDKYPEVSCINRCCNLIEESFDRSSLRDKICIKCKEYDDRLCEKMDSINIGDKITFRELTGKHDILTSYIVSYITPLSGGNQKIRMSHNSVKWRTKENYIFTLYKVLNNIEGESVIDVEGPPFYIKGSNNDVYFLESDDRDINVYSIEDISKKVTVSVDDGHIEIVQDKHFSTSTTEKGIFVAGDVADKIYRQAIVACGEGCKAAMDVISFLSK
jgi:thioredoxin reductase